MKSPPPQDAPAVRIRLVKHEDLGTVPDHPIFVGYTVEGVMTHRPTVGQCFTFWRINRNGVEALGIFRTSPVLKLLENDGGNSNLISFTTQNSEYSLLILD